VSEPILIVAALNGMRDRKVSKKVPFTPDELAAEAKRAVDAGAGAVHVQPRRDDGSPAFDLTIDEVVSAIRAVTDAPVSITTQRTRQTSLGTITALFDVLRELPDMATVHVRPQSPELPAHREEARQILDACERAGVAPVPVVNEFEAIGDIEALQDDGLLAHAPFLQLSLLPPGSDHGLSGTPQNVMRLADAVRGGTLGALPWVGHAGGPASAPVCATAAALGGSIRVGLEDSALLPDGSVASSNAEFVELAVALADALGREPMEPDEVRRLLRSGR
jgi:3-keto-5-aminohexanoate cleavage enzyme